MNGYSNTELTEVDSERLRLFICGIVSTIITFYIAYNIHGTLNLPFKNIEPKFKTSKVNLPNKITDVAFKKNSKKTTLIVKLNNDWELSFRIHNASSRIEPSLKFDINLLKAPNSLLKNTLSVS